MILHGYWRSSAAYRVRIALALKGLDYRQTAHDLRTGAHRTPSFRALNPQALVPALETPDGVLTQSCAIIEWLDEQYPDPPLLPATPFDRAVVRSMAALVACDIHPLNNLRVLDRLRGDFAATPDQITSWIGHWMSEGFAALEEQIARHGGDFAFGDKPGLADCFLLPQLYGAHRFGVDMQPFPLIRAIGTRLSALASVAQAHPDRQPDADRA